MKDQGFVTEPLNQTARDFTWLELIHDWPALTQLGSGVLWIDIATGQTHHNGRRVEPLHIAGVLQAWLRESLAGAQLSKSGTQDASLTAGLTVEHYSGQREPDSCWVGDPKDFVGCQAEVKCRLALGGVVAEATATEKMEWPDPGAA
jgi:hypothetical protein